MNIQPQTALDAAVTEQEVVSCICRNYMLYCLRCRPAMRLLLAALSSLHTLDTSCQLVQLRCNRHACDCVD